MKYQVLEQGTASFMYRKYCPILYYPVLGNLQEICEFQVVAHAACIPVAMYLSAISPVDRNSVFGPVMNFRLVLTLFLFLVTLVEESLLAYCMQEQKRVAAYNMPLVVEDSGCTLPLVHTTPVPVVG